MKIHKKFMLTKLAFSTVSNIKRLKATKTATKTTVNRNLKHTTFVEQAIFEY